MRKFSTVDLYDYIYSWKDYLSEADQIRKICNTSLSRPMTSLLEWACGTGRYLEAFSDIECIGVDLCRRSLEHANRRAPHAQLFCEDMAEFRPPNQVDVIIGLFGAIGYLDPQCQLPSALGLAYDSLAEDGLLILEPWVAANTFVKKQAFLQTFQTLNLQIARMVITDQVDMQSLLAFEYLVSIAGGGVQRLKSEERLWLSDDTELLRTIQQVGFKQVELQMGFMPDSKLWICRK